MSAVYTIEAGLESMKSSICNAAIGKTCFNTRNLSDPYPLNTPMFSPATTLEPQIPQSNTAVPVSTSPEPLPIWSSILNALLCLLKSYIDFWPIVLAYFLCALLTILFVRQIFLMRQLKLSKSTTKRHFDSLGLGFYQLRARVKQLLDLNQRRKRRIASLQKALSANGHILRQQHDLVNKMHGSLQKQVRDLNGSKQQAESQCQALQKELGDARKAQSHYSDAHQATQKQLKDLQHAKALEDEHRSTLEKQLTDAQDKKKAAKADYRALDKSYEEVCLYRDRSEHKIKALQRQVEKIQGYYGKLEKEHSELQHAHEQLEKFYDSVQRGHESQKKTIKNLEAFNKNEQRMVGELCEENDQLKKQLETADHAGTIRVQGQLDTANSEREEAIEASKASQEQEAARRAEAGFGGQRSVATEAHEDLKKQLQGLQSELQRQKDGRDKDNKQHESDYAMLQEQVTSYDASIEEARILSQVSNEQSKALLSEKQALQSRIEMLTLQLAELKRSQSSDKEEHKGLRQEIDDLKSRNQTASEMVKQAEDQVSRMASAWQDDKAAKQSLESQVNELFKQTEGAKQEIAQLKSHIEAMNAEGVRLQERIRFLEEPIDWENDPFFESLRLDTTPQTGADATHQGQQDEALNQSSAVGEQYPALTDEERRLISLTDFEKTSLTQGSGAEPNQSMGSDNVGAYSMTDNAQNIWDFQAFVDPETPATSLPATAQGHDDLTGPAETALSAQSLPSITPPFAQYQATPPQPNLPNFIEPLTISFEHRGNLEASSSNHGPMFGTEARETQPQIQIPNSEFTFTTPIATMDTSTAANPGSGSTSNLEATDTVSAFQPVETGHRFSAKDATNSERIFARPVTRNRALRQRQKGWAAEKASDVQQTSCNVVASNENAASASNAPTTGDAASEERVEWENVPIFNDNEQAGPISAAEPFTSSSTGLAFEEPDTSELERVFNDPTIPTSEAKQVTRSDGQAPNENEDSDSPLSDAPSESEDDANGSNDFSLPYNAPIPDFGIAHSPEVKHADFEGAGPDPEIAGSMP
ncbi:MAG: hypothetical protein Q9217_003585 [Psora testacea]